VFDADLRQLASDIEKGGGRYIFVGLRGTLRLRLATMPTLPT